MSEQFGKVFSLLRPGVKGTHSEFRRRTYTDINSVVHEAAQMTDRCKGRRGELLETNGLCYDDYIFNDKGDACLAPPLFAPAHSESITPRWISRRFYLRQRVHPTNRLAEWKLGRCHAHVPSQWVKRSGSVYCQSPSRVVLCVAVWCTVQSCTVQSRVLCSLVYCAVVYFDVSCTVQSCTM